MTGNKYILCLIAVLVLYLMSVVGLYISKCPSCYPIMCNFNLKILSRGCYINIWLWLLCISSMTMLICLSFIICIFDDQIHETTHNI